MYTWRIAERTVNIQYDIVWERKEIYSDPGLNNEFKIMHELIQEKDKKIQKLEEDVKGLQFSPNASTSSRICSESIFPRHKY